MELAVSIVSLGGLLLFLSWGLFSRWYDENLLQCLGLSLLTLWTLAELFTVGRMAWVSLTSMVLHVGLFSFAVGTATRTAYYAKKGKRRDPRIAGQSHGRQAR